MIGEGVAAGRVVGGGGEGETSTGVGVRRSAVGDGVEMVDVLVAAVGATAVAVGEDGTITTSGVAATEAVALIGMSVELEAVNDRTGDPHAASKMTATTMARWLKISRA